MQWHFQKDLTTLYIRYLIWTNHNLMIEVVILLWMLTPESFRKHSYNNFVYFLNISSLSYTVKPMYLTVSWRLNINHRSSTHLALILICYIQILDVNSWFNCIIIDGKRGNNNAWLPEMYKTTDITTPWIWRLFLVWCICIQNPVCSVLNISLLLIELLH